VRVEYEDHLLGALLSEPALLDREDITGELFTASPARAVFKVMRGLREAGHPVSVLTVSDSMNGQLAEVGGTAYLASLSGVSPANVEFYVERLQEAARSRALVKVSRQLADDIESGKESSAIIEHVEKELLGIRSLDSRAAEVNPGEVLRQIIATAEARTATDGGCLGVTTGFQSIDRILGGFLPGSVYVLAARTSVGKTALALSIIDEQLHRGIPVAMASLEMSATQVLERLLLSRADIPAHRLRFGTLGRDDFAALVDACSPLLAAPFHLLDQPALTVLGLRCWARQVVEKGARVLYVDYLGLLDPGDTNAPRWEVFASISRSIKALARELEIPVVCLAQLNRAAAEDGNPGLHQIRDSGSFEQDADVVAILMRDEPGEDDPDIVPARLVVKKNRSGPTGRVSLAFKRSTVRFREVMS
jgi:replicative DNA helicase